MRLVYSTQTDNGSISHDVLFTGSAGHLGTALMLALPELGFNPVGVDLVASPTTAHARSVADRAFVDGVLRAHPGIRHVVHAATLHKPYVGSHSREAFVATNISGTLVLLEEAAAALALDSFVLVSTRAFGKALSPPAGQPAAWIDEAVAVVPKNIYGVTKAAAEDLCVLVHAQTRMPVVVLRTSRFFPEADDNLKVLELAYRRIDMADVVDATACAMRRARDVGWGRYVVSAPPPFTDDADTLAGLDWDPGAVLRALVPGVDAVSAQRGWRHLDRIDRVYDSARAVRELGWRPRYTFVRVIERLARGDERRSELALRVGKKGYHAVNTGVYTER